MAETTTIDTPQASTGAPAKCLNAAYETWTDYEQPVEIRAAAAGVLEELAHEGSSTKPLEDGERRTTLFACGEKACAAACFLTYGSEGKTLVVSQAPVGMGAPSLSERCELPVQD